MNDEAGFLAAIIANPDENTPRLVYADWLDEHDQPEWAEFIRVQIEMRQLQLAIHPAWKARHSGRRAEFEELVTQFRAFKPRVDDPAQAPTSHRHLHRAGVRSPTQRSDGDRDARRRTPASTRGAARPVEHRG